jgi:hypothetical protein
MTPKTRTALEMAQEYFTEYSGYRSEDVAKAITEALTEPAPRRLTRDDIRQLFFKNSVSFPGKYEVTPGQAERIARAIEDRSANLWRCEMTEYTLPEPLCRDDTEHGKDYYIAKHVTDAYAAGLEVGRKESINAPFERVPQHAFDPGCGPVPPEPKTCPHGVDKQFAFNCPECKEPGLGTLKAPEGWQLVPIEPTPDMVRSGKTDKTMGQWHKKIKAAWAVMLATAPEYKP